MIKFFLWNLIWLYHLLPFIFKLEQSFWSVQLVYISGVPSTLVVLYRGWRNVLLDINDLFDILGRWRVPSRIVHVLLHDLLLLLLSLCLLILLDVLWLLFEQNQKLVFYHEQHSNGVVAFFDFERRVPCLADFLLTSERSNLRVQRAELIYNVIVWVLREHFEALCLVEILGVVYAPASWEDIE